ncbi:hypothetical protein K1719_035225 [Acacia pycnantha]|nr:hypothetical protein K1719_035225 [Acacia pycnantha]
MFSRLLILHYSTSPLVQKFRVLFLLKLEVKKVELRSCASGLRFFCSLVRMESLIGSDKSTTNHHYHGLLLPSDVADEKNKENGPTQ